MASGNILVITYWSYKDALIQTYTLPYVRMIKEFLPPESKIFLVTLEQPQLKITKEEAEKIGRELAAQGIHLVSYNYSRFGWKALIKWQLFLTRLLFLCYRERIRRLHAWCTPGGGVGYLLSVLTGIPLIIDSYEPHAESMVENGEWKKGSIAFRLLFLLEKLQSRRAQAVIATASGMKLYAREKYQAALARFYVKPACVDTNDYPFEFVKDKSLLETYGLKDKLVCVYAGKIGGIYLEREIFDFLKVASDFWGNKFHALLLTNARRQQIEKLAAQSRLDPAQITSRFVAHADIPKHLGLGDFAINPVKPVPTKRFCTSIKDGEYWAMGLPVVITPNISDDSEIIEENKTGAIIEDFSVEAYLRAVKEIDALLRDHSRRELFDKIRAIAVRYRSFADAKEIYKELYGGQNH